MENNSIYKGYRLSAIVKRQAPGSQPSFTATLVMVRHGGSVSTSHGVPDFVKGGGAATPGRAIDAAILYGRQMVDGMSRAAMA
ncbi:hypothetical protein CAL29_22920 [Bordetella genomosp. 10]|uniref:Uncharacterized protein n=1 Tax=Bordetella genomosp. 10 TaxID=1416804 RepID=A0A261S110_9BORD|nr:hypothetical protein [Bordetella genomosp. 10]OZI30831.1 hypothetical protein CAL29_22920 [Bordetella genomosp. 10]